MSGLPYQGGMNSYMFDMSQYGVNMPRQDNTGQYLQSASGLASLIPYIGPLLSAGMNVAGTMLQNQQQEYFYRRYMSPQARMRDMAAAGINPNAAAQGIAGSAAPQMNAAPMTSAFSALGEQLGNSANTVLTADVLRSEAQKNRSEAGLNDSLNVEKTITNSYLDRQQQAALNKLISEGQIAKSTANMLAVDEAYKPATAFASYEQLLMNLERTGKEIELLGANIEHEYAAAYQAMMAGNLSEAQIHKVFSDIGLNNAQIQKISHEIAQIDATTSSIYQDINESKARQMVLDIQNKFQGDYYDIWKNTGFNWNSDIESSIVYSIANCEMDNASRIISGLSHYIDAVGDAKVSGADYQFDKYFELYGDISRLVGIVGGARAISSGSGAGAPGFRPKSQGARYSDGRQSLWFGPSAAPKLAGSRSYGRGR